MRLPPLLAGTKAPPASTKASSPTWSASLPPAASLSWFTRMCLVSSWDKVNEAVKKRRSCQTASFRERGEKKHRTETELSAQRSWKWADVMFRPLCIFQAGCGGISDGCFFLFVFFNKSITDVMKCVGVPTHAKGHAASMVVSSK